MNEWMGKKEEQSYFTGPLVTAGSQNTNKIETNKMALVNLYIPKFSVLGGEAGHVGVISKS